MSNSWGRRIGNWLTPEEGQRLLSAVPTDRLRGKRDAAMLGLLIGCGLRRSELVELNVDQIQQREGHWVIIDLIGKGGRLRTVPMPGWVKDAVDDWVCSAEITEGRLFRAVRKNGVLWGHGLTQNVVWYVVKECAKRAGIQNRRPMICEGAALACAMNREGSWSRFNSCSVTPPY